MVFHLKCHTTPWNRHAGKGHVPLSEGHLEGFSHKDALTGAAEASEIVAALGGLESTGGLGAPR